MSGWIIVQKWDDEEVVVGPGSHIFKTQEEAEATLSSVHTSWEAEVAKDKDAEWLKHTGKPFLRKISWDEPVAQAGDGNTLHVREPSLTADGAGL